MKTLIIGAGPAGLSAAYHSACEGNEVILIERNEKAGRKLYITGKGRCNVTNNCNNEDIIKNVISNPKFLYSSLSSFSSKDTIEYFESHNVKLVTERGNRVFPASYHASDITKALVEGCLEKGVKIIYREKANKITLVNGLFEVIASENRYLVDNLVIATGGLSYPTTGSTGDGYKFAKEFGHTICELVPGLSAIKLKENIPYKLNKMLFKNVKIIVSDGKWKHEEFGDIMFDSNTLDGPISLTVSSLINRRIKENIHLELDLKPALDEEKLDDRLLREISKNASHNIFYLLKQIMPIDFIPWFLEKCPLDSYKKCGDMSVSERKTLIRTIKHFPLTYDGLVDIKRAIVTSGGINVKEINAKTMESKIVPNLYFAGEVIDVDALTGGFNIQIALSTGALVGKTIKSKI